MVPFSNGPDQKIAYVLQDRFTTCFKTCGTNSWVFSKGFKKGSLSKGLKTVQKVSFYLSQTTRNQPKSERVRNWSPCCRNECLIVKWPVNRPLNIRPSSLVFSNGRFKNLFSFTRDSYKSMLLSFSYVKVSQKTYTRDEGTICLGRGDNFYSLSLRKTFFTQHFESIFQPVQSHCSVKEDCT